jgi:hypothetical protein
VAEHRDLVLHQRGVGEGDLIHAFLLGGEVHLNVRGRSGRGEYIMSEQCGPPQAQELEVRSNEVR